MPWPTFIFPSNHIENFKPFSLSNVLFSWLHWHLVLAGFFPFSRYAFFFFLIHWLIWLGPEVLSLSLTFTAVLFYPNPTHSSESYTDVTSSLMVRAIPVSGKLPALSALPPPLTLCRNCQCLAMSLVLAGIQGAKTVFYKDQKPVNFCWFFFSKKKRKRFCLTKGVFFAPYLKL